MDLEISIEKEKNSFNQLFLPYIFIIYDIKEKKILSLRMSKSESSKVDQIRSLHASIKRLNLNLKDEDIFIIQDTSYIYFHCCERFSKINSKRIQANKISIMPIFLNFLNNLDGKDTKSNRLVTLFNNFLKEENHFEITKIESEIFLRNNFDNEKKLINLEFENIFFRRKKEIYLNFLESLRVQKCFFRIEFDLAKINCLLISYRLASDKILKTKDKYGFIQFTTIVLPNSFEIELIFLNAGFSVIKNSDFFSVFLKLCYFLLYFLGFSINDIYFIKLQDLDKLLTENVVTFNLENKVKIRTIMSDTRKKYISIQQEIETLFDCSGKLKNTKNSSHLSPKTIALNINKDLKKISIILKITFTVETIRAAAIFRLLCLKNDKYVAHEFEISQNFIKKFSKIYSMKGIN